MESSPMQPRHDDIHGNVEYESDVSLHDDAIQGDEHTGLAKNQRTEVSTTPIEGLNHLRLSEVNFNSANESSRSGKAQSPTRKARSTDRGADKRFSVVEKRASGAFTVRADVHNLSDGPASPTRRRNGIFKGKSLTDDEMQYLDTKLTDRKDKLAKQVVSRPPQKKFVTIVANAVKKNPNHPHAKTIYGILVREYEKHVF